MAIPFLGFEEGLPEEQQEPEYTDEPLDTVVRDNLEVDCVIAGKPYDLMALEVTLTDGSESNWAKGVVVPRGHNREPQPGRGLDNPDQLPDKITIDVDNKLTEIREDTGEITRIFTGVISNSSRIERGAFEFMAFWPGFNEIQNGSLVLDFPPADKVDKDAPRLNDAGGLPVLTTYGDRYQMASTVAKSIGELVTGDDPRFDYNVLINDDGVKINGITYAKDVKIKASGVEEPITADSPTEGLLERVVKATNTVWEVDRYGNFYIGPPTPGNRFPTSVDSHKLRYITETSAGKQSPTWRSVAVIGDGIVSQDGWASNALINENPQKFSTPLTTKGSIEQLDEDLAEPTYVYKNLEISTAEEAKNILTKIRDDIRKQAAGGEIDVVGHPEVWPGDAVEMPDTKKQPFELDRFGVGKVIHRLNNSDGFMTKIKVMGQTNATESLYSDEVTIDNPGRYPTLIVDRDNGLGGL